MFLPDELVVVAYGKVFDERDGQRSSQSLMGHISQSKRSISAITGIRVAAAVLAKSYMPTGLCATIHVVNNHARPLAPVW